jgi:hypothetical protein|tara:strand:+ start:183 stop:464 length:282 start_codon:yes stop_codon:yes gene_type:complete
MFSSSPSLFIEEGKGFQMTFKNGWTVSVQWGEGNYADNETITFEGKALVLTGEVAVIMIERKGEKDRILYPMEVQGWVTPDKVVEIMFEVSHR